jgi:HK97 gp10 family phage protein
MAKSSIVGGDAVKKRLQGMSRGITQASIKRLIQAGELVRKDAVESIRAGAVSGKGHVPSRPGEPPNADTHRLDRSIHVEVNESGLTVTVVADAPYAAALEFGHAKLVERPFLRPALQRNRSRIVLGQVQASQDVVRVYKSDIAVSNASARYAASQNDD